MVQPSAPPVALAEALRKMLRHPIRTIVPPWSWKAAAFTAVCRALAFFVMNLRSGEHAATKAMLLEAVFAIFAGGLVGAISQYLRRAEPLWATAFIVVLALPGVMLLAQAGVHRLARTPHIAGGLLLSFLLAAFAAAYTWFAMRQGAMLGGVDQTSVVHDLKSLPRISLDFLLAGPRSIIAAGRR